MTLDDLVKRYFDVLSRELERTDGGGDCEREGIRAVVEALRDEINKNGSATWTLHQILASDGGEAAGSDFANPSEGRAITPAADVCEWWTDTWGAQRRKCDRARFIATTPLPNGCPSCGKPISFKETPP